MKRLSGGLILLNLCNISLDVTAGEVSIADSEILEQLTELRQFIDVQRDFSKGFKSLKPVLIEYRSSASKFNGVVQGNLSFDTDALHMSIGGMCTQKDGKTLIIAIKVEYEFVDFKGYVIKTAKINAYESNLVSDLNVSGDADITGDLSVGGTITGNEIIENMGSDYAFLTGTESTGFTQEDIYAGMVKNGNKLTLVFAFNLTKLSASPTERYAGIFYVPTEVWNKLYPAVLGDTAVLTQQKINALDTIGGAGIDVIGITYKASSRQIGINIQVANMVVNTKYYIRLEQTFLLSDNLAE